MWNFIQQTDVLNNYANFVPYANPDPSKYSHCNKLCDYKDACKKSSFVIVMLFWDEWMGFDWMAFRQFLFTWVASYANLLGCDDWLLLVAPIRCYL